MRSWTAEVTAFWIVVRIEQVLTVLPLRENLICAKPRWLGRVVWGALRPSYLPENNSFSPGRGYEIVCCRKTGTCELALELLWANIWR